MATVALGRYLWERIHQLGVNHIFGVPGDFNLTLLTTSTTSTASSGLATPMNSMQLTQLTGMPESREPRVW